MRKKIKPYSIIGAYDSETCNFIEDGMKSAIPILHQFGILDCPIQEIDASNVEDHTRITMFRHTYEAYAFLDSIVDSSLDYVPVIVCHNLSFDMYPLAEWLNSHEVKVLAKSKRKPITFTIMINNDKKLVIWDSLVFSQKSLSMMGHECGYEKLSGEWDYSLIRTPETVLSERELEYASHDIYALLAWFGYWLNMNPDIDPDYMALRVCTKTGVVRLRRSLRFDGLRAPGRKQNTGRYWNYVNRTNMPKTDDELFMLHAATRGGFTFCSKKWASVPITPDSGYCVAGYDAKSQHPAQMVSHYYPVSFHEANADILQNAFDLCACRSIDYVLDRYDKPFLVAFYACFEFRNLRPKKNSLFAREGIYPAASARFSKAMPAIDEDNEDNSLFMRSMLENGYKDYAKHPIYAFGKLESASVCRLWLTELAAWEIAQCYDYDSVKAISGYFTMKFMRPTDMAVLSVMQFYKAKDVFKRAMNLYKKEKRIDSELESELKSSGIAESIISDMRNGCISESDLKFVYQSLKADLNGLFGIEATNEYRKDTILGADGIDYTGEDGISNAPKNPKAWYQFGQRIVGWSRIAQIINMQLAYPYCEGIVNGDTDSIKFVCEESAIDKIDNALSRYGYAIDKAKRKVCERVEKSFPECFSSLDCIGHYEREFIASHFCASWNKAYVISDGKTCEFTLAGIPAGVSHVEMNLNAIANDMLANGSSFDDVCNELLGYNLTIANSITGLNMRAFPEWGAWYTGTITDYKGDSYDVAEPYALALFPMAKTINDTTNPENRGNYDIAYSHNEHIADRPRLLYFARGKYHIEEMQG